MTEKAYLLALCHHKSTPRSDEELRQLQNRLKRMAGQLGGIGKMLDDKPLLRRHSDPSRGGGKRLAGLWLSYFTKTYGDLCGRRDSKGTY